jgi:RecA/RadA recombinase
MSSMMDRLKKTSSVEIASVLENSEVFGERQNCPTEVPIINIALSGTLKGGLTSGVTQIAGPSKHFKTGLALLLMRSFQTAHKDGAILFYDSEFGSPPAYFDTFGVDKKKVFHTPITDVEQLKHDIMIQLAEAKRGDPLMIVIDSIGQLASLKEVEDAIEGKSVADMTRAKAIKSLFRMITPHLKIKDIPLVVINHTYKEIGMFPKDIVGGGTGSYFAADTIWIVGRQQEKVDGKVEGFNFVLNIEKSRQVKEKSKFPVTAIFDYGIEQYSGLLQIALDGGFVEKPSPGWYIKKGEKTKVREADTKDMAFWKDILENEAFNEYVRKTFQVAYGDILAADPDADTTEKGK